MTRICSKCQTAKDEALFPPRKRGLQCKECLAAAKRVWCSKNPDKVIVSRRKTNEWHKKNADRVHDNLLRSRYGVTQADVDEMIVQQDNLCAICNKPPSGKTKRDHRLFLDHCHKTGKVRGMLCNDCNLALGRVHDNVDILKSMIEYLKTNG